MFFKTNTRSVFFSTFFQKQKFDLYFIYKILFLFSLQKFDLYFIYKI